MTRNSQSFIRSFLHSAFIPSHIKVNLSSAVGLSARASAGVSSRVRKRILHSYLCGAESSLKPLLFSRSGIICHPRGPSPSSHPSVPFIHRYRSVIVYISSHHRSLFGQPSFRYSLPVFPVDSFAFNYNMAAVRAF